MRRAPEVLVLTLPPSCGDSENIFEKKYRLAVFPVGFALFAEGAETLLRIFQAIEFVEEDVHGIAEPVAKREAHAAENGFLGHGEHRARVAGDARA